MPYAASSIYQYLLQPPSRIGRLHQASVLPPKLGVCCCFGSLESWTGILPRSQCPYQEYRCSRRRQYPCEYRRSSLRRRRSRRRRRRRRRRCRRLCRQQNRVVPLRGSCLQQNIVDDTILLMPLLRQNKVQ